MGFLCGKKCECKRRCKSYFPGLPDMEDACKKACSDDTGLTREKFLCSGKYVDEQEYIIQLGIDPCAGGASVQDVLDPFNSREQEAERLEQLTPILLGLGIVVLAALAILYIVKRK